MVRRVGIAHMHHHIIGGGMLNRSPIPYTMMAVRVAHNERQLIILWTRRAGHGMDRAVRMKVGLARGGRDH